MFLKQTQKKSKKLFKKLQRKEDRKNLLKPKSTTTILMIALIIKD